MARTLLGSSPFRMHAICHNEQRSRFVSAMLWSREICARLRYNNGIRLGHCLLV